MGESMKAGNVEDKKVTVCAEARGGDEDRNRTHERRQEEPASGTVQIKEEALALEEVSVSVRRLVEFILRHGDIDNRRHVSPENAMQEGGRIHRMIQRRMGAEYQAEVPLKMTFPADGYMLSVYGREDGIIRKDGSVTID